MRKLSLFVCLLVLSSGALLTVGSTIRRAANLQRQVEVFGLQKRPAQISAIETFAKGLDQYSKLHPKERRFFVDSSPEGQAGWNELKSEDEVSDAEGNYAHKSVIVSLKGGEIIIAAIGEPLEHSRHDDAYYFRGDGTLAKIASSFGSNVGNARYLRNLFYDEAGRSLGSSTFCYEIYPKQKRTSCTRGYVREQLNDHRIAIYRNSRELPVYEMLKKH